MKTMLGLVFSANEEKAINALTLRKIEKINLIIIIKYRKVGRLNELRYCPLNWICQ
jgi:hypothetical protein